MDIASVTRALLSELEAPSTLVTPLREGSDAWLAAGRVAYLTQTTELVSAIGVGVALAQGDARVIVLEHGSSSVASLQAFAVVGTQRPHNLLHVLLAPKELVDEHGSPRDIEIDSLASALGYRATHRASDEHALCAALRVACRQPGPVMVIATATAPAATPAL